MILRKILLFAFALGFTPVASAAGKANISLTASPAAAGIKLIFKTEPAAGLKVNEEGPWKLEIKSSGPLTLSKTVWNRPDWKSEIAGFEVPATFKGKVAKVDIAYKMTVFVCTADKTQCFREVLEETAKVSW